MFNALKKIFKGKGINNKKVVLANGCSLTIPHDMAWAFNNGEYYEKNFTYFLDKIVGGYKDPVMIDIGANYGYYSIRYSKLCKNIFSFEPVTTTYNILQQNIEMNGIKNITAFKCGLSDVESELKINLYSSSGNNSFFERNIPKQHPLKKIGTETVKLETLDQLVHTNKVAIPDILKIDVEGAELKVLKGAEHTIVSHRPAVLMEYSKETSIDAGYSREMLLNVVGFNDYKIYGIPEDENDLSLIEEKYFSSKGVSNLIFLPQESGVNF